MSVESPSAQTHSRIYTGPQTDILQAQAKFLIYFNYSGQAVFDRISTAVIEIIDTLDILVAINQQAATLIRFCGLTTPHNRGGPRIGELVDSRLQLAKHALQQNRPS